MADIPDEAATQSQVHGCSSFPLSFPSQPPGIKNWFSSYEYESPEAPELVGDPGGDISSETQDPLEYRVSGHPLLKHATPLRENCFGSQSEHEVSATRDLAPIGSSTVERGAKRKQSLRELFGAGFLDDSGKPSETERRVVLAEQINSSEPLANCKAIGLPDTKGSQEGAVEHSKLPVDCYGISLADSRESSPGYQETEHIKLPVNCDGTSLADTRKSSREDAIEHGILPINCNGIVSADTEEPGDETGRGKPAMEDKKQEETASTDGFVAIKRKEKPREERKVNKIPKPSMGRENATLKENQSNLAQKVLVQERTRCPLADRTNFSDVATAPTPELPGKWKCPRKGKPYVGPPLKQLRLEQWVRRVN